MTTEQNLALLRATVQAKIAYWDALRALEIAIAPDGEFSDVANNAVIDQIDMLAAGSSDVANASVAMHVTKTHLAVTINLAQRQSVPY